MLAHILLVAQLAVTVTAPDTIAVDSLADVVVRVTSQGTAPASLRPPRFASFVVVRTGSAQRTEIDRSGRTRYVAEFRYTLGARRAGNFPLGPFVAVAGARTASSEPRRLVVRADPVVTTAPAIVTRARLDTSTVSFHAVALPDTVYVGGQATYQLAVFLSESIRDRVRKMEAVAPEMRGMLAYEPLKPLVVFPATGPTGRRYDAHVYQRALFPLAAGRHVIPPARLIYAMPLSNSFFSPEESYEIRSESTVVIAVEPPLVSRPAGYTGAVGDLRAEARLGSDSLRVGDPVALTVRVRGAGNVKLLPRPDVNIAWATVVAADENVSLDQDPLVVRGTKEFGWVLTPTRAGRLVLPPIRYPYFDPTRRRYEVAETRPETVTVAPGALAAADSSAADSTRRLALRATYRGPLSKPLHHSPVFWLTLALAPLPALARASVRRARRPRPRAADSVRLRQFTRDRRPAAARDVRRAFAGALAQRLDVSAEQLTAAGAVARAARRAGASPEAALDAERLMRELDEASFAPTPSEVPDAAHRALVIYKRLDAETIPSDSRLPGARMRPPTQHGVLLLAVAIAAGAAALATAQGADDTQLFRDSVAHYQRGAAAEAARGFQTLADRAPRAPDAWANLGTAAWASGDTATAAVGWQRALRLEPLASDVRERVSLLPGVQDGLAAVPVVGPTFFAVTAALLWIAGWLAAAFGERATRRVPWPSGRAPRGRVLALAGSALALLFAALAWTIEAQLAGRDLAVVTQRLALRVVPSLTGDSTDLALTGEVARVVASRGDWAHVRADGGRDGWVRSDALIPLGASGRAGWRADLRGGDGRVGLPAARPPELAPRSTP